MTQRIALIFGGKSGEHDVSIKTAFSILQAVDYTKYLVTPVYVTIDGDWLYSSDITERPNDNHSFLSFSKYREVNDFIRFFESIDVAFPVIHGPNGEDGTLQGLLEIVNVPYVGSGVIGSSLGMDKAMMKVVFEQFQLPQGPYLSFTRKQLESDPSNVLAIIENQLNYPVFVKPANLGSSIGISKARNVDELMDALDLAFRFDQKIVVEAMIIGRELEIGVLGHEELITSEVGEISTSKDFYDYEAKYENQEVTQLCIPADAPIYVKEEMALLAKKAFQSLGCSGLSRVDFFWDETNDLLFINEINTMPGFTPLSMYPMLFKEIGVSYTELINKLIGYAFEKDKEKQKNQISASNHTEKKELSFFK